MQETPKPLKVPLFQAAATLATLCQRIEDGEELDDAVISAFDDAKGLVAESIDRRKALLRELDAKLEVARSYKAEADYHIKRFEAIKRKVKEATREVIEANPDVPYRDSLGKKLSVCKAAPSLKLTFDMRSVKSFSNVLDPDCIDLLGIDRKYIKEISFYSLDTEAVKGDLLAGVELPSGDTQNINILKGFMMQELQPVNNHAKNDLSLSLAEPIAQPQELIQYHEEVTKIIQASLKKDTDYGVIPGTGNKPTLLKPGAERLCLAFGAHPSYELVSSEVDHDRKFEWSKRKKVWARGKSEFVDQTGTSQGLYRYVYNCRIVRADGRILGEGQGVCSSLESKYIEAPRNAENTICKMAQKRALVAATLNAFGLSDRFTQDIEDFSIPTITVQEPSKGNGFDKTNEKHVSVLKKALAERKIEEKFFEKIIEMMSGKTFDKLDEVIYQAG